MKERVDGFEPTNGSLGSYCLTTWLHPRTSRDIIWRPDCKVKVRHGRGRDGPVIAATGLDGASTLTGSYGFGST